MAQTIKLRRSATQGGTPTVSQLSLGEVAINTYDGKMYIKKDSGTESIVEIGGGNLPLTGGTMTGDLALGDNVKATFGAGDDLQIYHDGGNSIITNSTGNLIIRDSVGGNILIQGLQNQPSVDAIANGAVNLYYSGNARLATTSTGIDVTGIVDASNLVRFGVNNSEIANNYVRFKPAGAAYIDHSTVGQVINFRVSGSSSLDTNALTIKSTGIDVTGTATMDGLISSNISGTTLIQAVGVDSNGFADVEIKSTGTSGSSRLYFSDTAAQSGSIKYNHSDNSMQFATAATERMRINSSGNVGIGASSIDYQASNRTVVHIEGSAGALLAMEDTGAKSYLFQTGNDLLIENDTSAGSIIFGTNASTERMRIDAGGNVGIGTSSPQRSLHIQTNTASYGSMRVYRDSTSQGETSIGFFGSTTTAANAAWVIGEGGWVGGKNFVIGNENGGAGGNVRLKVSQAGAVTFNEAFTFPTADGSANQLLQTDGSGNVSWATVSGSGSTTSIADADNNTKIQVEESADENKIRFDTAGSERMIIDAGGKVGIGTTSPSDAVHISKATFPTLKLEDTGLSSNLILQTHSDSSEHRLTGTGAYPLVFKTNDSERMRIDASGLVTVKGSGAGSVSDHFRIESSDTESKLGFVNTTGNGAIAQSGGAMRFMTNTANTERMRIDASGNVGIGTSSPGAKLHVKKTSAGTTHVDGYASAIIEDTEARLQIISDDGGNNASSILLSNETKHWAIMHQGPLSNNRFSIGYDLTTASGTDIVNTSSHIFNITPSGNVGIGTTSPIGALDVSGTTNAHTTVAMGPSTAATDKEIYLDLYRSNSSNVRQKIGVLRSGIPIAGIRGAELWSYQALGLETANTGSGHIVFKPKGAERMRIDASGNVGIGESNPQELLHLTATTPVFRMQGGSRTYQQFVSGTDFVIRDVNAGLNRVTLNSSGNVGIGTSTPDTKLHLVDSTPEISLTRTSDFYYGRLSADGFSAFSNTNSNAPIIFKTATNERMRIDSSGNVGIGNSSPNERLVVADTAGGTIAAFTDTTTADLLIKCGAGVATITPSTGILAFGTSSTERMRIDSSGNVSIGSSTNPDSRKLRVYGISEIDGAGVGLLKFKSSGTEIGSVGQGNYVVSGGPAGGFGMQAEADLVFGSGGTNEAMRIDSSGNVSIGTSTTSAPLRVNVGTDQNCSINTSGGNPRITAHNDAANVSVPLGFNGSILKFEIGGTERMRIDASGDMIMKSGRIKVRENDDGNDAVVITRDADEGYVNLYSAGSQTIEIRGNGNSYFNGGNVGIGTDSPSEKLHIQGDGADILLTDAAGGQTAKLGATGSNNGLLELNNSAHVGIVFLNSSGDSYLNGGNVGIGTSSPSAKIHLGTTGSEEIGIGLQNSQRYYGIQTTGGALTVKDVSAGGTERMRITAAGNVGIGTTAPSNKLQVVGNARIEGNLMAGGAAASNVAARPIHVKSAGDAAAIRIEDTSSSNLVYDMRVTYGEGLHFINVTGGITPMTLGSTGNVGIGTTAPTEKLVVNGSLNSSSQSANFSTGPYRALVDIINASKIARLGTVAGTNTPTGAQGEVSFIVNGNEKVRIKASGNVGIGTTNPVQKLQIDGGNFYANGGSYYVNNNAGLIAVGDLKFTTHDGSSYNTTMYLKGSTGNVGIGTTAPAAKLQVEALGIDTTVTSTTATTQVAIDSMVAATFRSARYTIQITNSTDGTYHLTEMLLIHNGTTPSINEFGTIYTGSAAEAVFTADINSGNVRILATPASTDAMAFKVVRHSITV